MESIMKSQIIQNKISDRIGVLKYFSGWSKNLYFASMLGQGDTNYRPGRRASILWDWSWKMFTINGITEKSDIFLHDIACSFETSGWIFFYNN